MSKLTVNERTSIIDDLINNTDDWAEDDRDTLTGLTDNQLKSIVANAVLAEEAVTTNNNEEEEEFEAYMGDESDPGDEDEEDDDEHHVQNQRRPQPQPKPKTVVRRQPAFNSAEEYLNNAPAEVRPALRDIIANHKELKRQLVRQLTANRNCPYSKQELTAMDTTDLRKLAQLAGASGPVYNGANAGEFSLTDNNLEDEAPLPRMSVDFTDKQTA